MKFRQLLVIAISSMLLGWLDAKPNVLFIAIDDLRPELGCYGIKEIHTPHIDGLAAKGLQFNRAYCQLAVCNPSRVSVLTGLRPDTAKVWTLDRRFRETVPDALTLPRHFKDHGYHTVGFGKVFHNPWPDNQSWSRPHAWPKKSKLWSESARKELLDFQDAMRVEGKSAKSIDRLRARATEVVDIPDSEHVDGAIADQAISELRRAAKKQAPFFLAAGFIRPHLPFVVPKQYWDLYDRDSIPLAASQSIPANTPDYAMNTMYELRDYMDFLNTDDPGKGSLTEAQQRELKHGYFASVSFIDAQAGRILAELKALGKADNTIIVIWSDHGWKLGEHRSWCKQTNYEIDARVPLIIHHPGIKATQATSDSLVELVDLFPTLCDLTDLPIPKQLEGKSLKPILANPNKSVKEVALSQFPRRYQDRNLMGYSMRTNNWRYIEWIDRQSKQTVDRELYDHSEDHSESMCVADEPAHQSLLIELAAQLRNSLPTGLAPEDKYRKKVRPALSFQNSTTDELTIYWLPAKGDRKQVGKIKPGKSTRQNTTKGHRFLVEGPNYHKVFTVTKDKETVEIKAQKQNATKPNIVVIMGDDWSWPHASILGDPVVKTPTFDRIAREGTLYKNAFVSSPSCTPSRHAIVSGQYHWRLGEGANLGGSIAANTPVYPDLLKKIGYQTGFCRKGTAPSKHTYRGNDPLGTRYRNFEEFHQQLDREAPFCFWYGAGEPHRPYDWQASKISDLDLSKIEVPPYLPDNETTRTDLGDYYLRVQKLDQLAGEIIDRLEKAGQLENTIVVMTGDNGMPFPRAKATLYDSGTRVPLAIRRGKNVASALAEDSLLEQSGLANHRLKPTLQTGSICSDFVTLTDLAPTFLQAAGLPLPKEMTGRSQLSNEHRKNYVITGMEQHVYPYPARAIRTKDYLYIRNFAPESWPTGKVNQTELKFDFKETPWPTVPGAFSYNIDPGPTKQWMRLNESPLNQLSFRTRAAEELYHLPDDPHQLNNLIAGRNWPKQTEDKRQQLSNQLTEALRASDDPRFVEKNHATFSIRGWTIHLNDQLWAEEADITRRMLELLDGQLKRVVDVAPKKALAQIREIQIWINPPYQGSRGTAEYHPGAGWLRENGRLPKMARSVEITNTKNFPFENRRMPYVMLHELAHGYHHRILEDGYKNAEITELYQKAKASGSYDNVARFNGIKTITDKAYAMSNPMEYFAESTEAYFGKNDFFPFNRSELKKHDPAIHDLVRKLWAAP